MGQQNNYLTVNVVHSNMYLVHHNHCQITIVCVCVCGPLKLISQEAFCLVLLMWPLSTQLHLYNTFVCGCILVLVGGVQSVPSESHASPSQAKKTGTRKLCCLCSIS